MYKQIYTYIYIDRERGGEKKISQINQQIELMREKDWQNIAYDIIYVRVKKTR